MTPELHDQVAALCREVAAEIILPRFRTLAAHEIDTKTGPEDLVTVADREAELALTPRLMDLLPGSRVVGEEAAAVTPSILDYLSSDGYVWVVDPVDGTANFVAGKPQFAIMVALVRDGESLLGWIYPPVEGVMAMAEKGAGAQIDGVATKARKSVPLGDAQGDYSSKYVAQPHRDELTARMAQAAGTRQGHCSAYAYLDTARGQIDFVLQYLMSPWDHGPGTLLVSEAGGASRFLDNGETYTPTPRKPRAMLSVGDGAMWDSYADALAAKG